MKRWERELRAAERVANRRGRYHTVGALGFNMGTRRYTALMRKLADASGPLRRVVEALDRARRRGRDRILDKLHWGRVALERQLRREADDERSW